MSKFFNSFLFKLLLTVLISIFIGTQLAKIELGEAQHSFRKILGEKKTNIEDPGLTAKITDFLKEKDGEYAIYVYDLTPGGKRNVAINSDKSLEAASLYKVFLMGAVFNAVTNGTITLDTEISAKLSHLEEVFGSVDFGYQDLSSDEVATYTVRESLQRVAEISDNYAAIMLAEKIGWKSVQSFADEVGATQTVISSPILTSAEDIGLFFKKLYLGESLPFEAGEEILNMLSKSKLNNRIPAKLPDNLKIAHKTGELAGVRNDAGIVFLESNPYIIVMMSQNLKGEDNGVENLAEISRIVYEYYASNQK